MKVREKKHKGKLCGMCNDPAIGYGRIPPGQAHAYVCEKHKERVVELKPLP